MKSIFKISLFVFSLILSINSFSQKNYTYGYIYDLEGKKKPGYIEYKDWNYNPRTIKYKESLQDEAVEYSPLDIQGFSIGIRSYFSAIVEKETSSRKLGNLDPNPDLNIQVDTAFLYCIINGPKSLYKYHRIGENENFYIKVGEEYQLLAYKKYIKTLKYADDPASTEYKRQTTGYFEIKTYVGQLAIYLNDCQNLINTQGKPAYEQYYFEKIFSSYKKCIELPEPKIETQYKGTAEFGIQAGITLSNLNFKSFSDSYYIHLLENSSPSANLTLGARINSISGNDENFHFGMELLYASFNQNFSSLIVTGQETYSSVDGEVGFWSLKFCFVPKYNIVTGPQKIYLLGGISLGVNKEYTNRYYQKNYSTLTNTVASANEGVLITHTKYHELGIVLGAGWRYKNVFLEGRIDFGNGVTIKKAINTSTRRLFIHVGYYL